MKEIEIFAHRGASGYAPENTMSSFKKAINMDAKGIELDVCLTKDKKVVVIHDDTIDRTSNGKGKVAEFDYEYLKKLDFGLWYSKEYKDEKIPLLQDVLKLIKNTDIILNIELKSNLEDNSNLLVKKVLNIIEKYNIKDNIIISSFNHKYLEEVRKIDKDIEIGLLYEGYFIDIVGYAKRLKATSIHPKDEFVDLKLVEECKKSNIKIRTWTVNDKKSFNKFKNYNIDSVITNYPDIDVR